MPGVWRPAPTELRIPRNVLATTAGAAFASWVPELGVHESPLCDVPDLTALRLYKHQADAVRHIADRGCVLLADPPGVGKTAAAATSAALRQHDLGGTRPVLIVAPKFLARTWRNELTRLGLCRDGQFLQIAGGSSAKSTYTTEQVRAARWIFVHYEVVAGWWSWLQLCRPCACVLDEAHYVKNARSLRGKAAQLVASLSSMRIVMTGTPVLNRVTELHALLELVSGPQTWGLWHQFRDRYMWNDGFGTGVRNEVELRQRIAPYYLRRELADVGINLPRLTRELVKVDLEAAALKQYTDLVGGLDPADLVRAILGKRAGRRTIEFLGRLRKITARAKTHDTIELARSLIDQGEPVIVFTWERVMANQIASGLTDVGIVHGDIAQSKRDDIVDAFGAGTAHSGGLVATWGALGAGVTLTRSRYVIMHDLDYVPATLLQAEARVHRLTQTRPTTSLWMTASDTIDAVMAALIDRKSREIAASVGDEAPATLADIIREDEIDSLNAEIANIVEWCSRGGR